MVDLKKIGQFFEKNGLWDKPFNLWKREEIEALCEVIFSSPSDKVPRDGWKTPYIKETKGNHKGENKTHLVIPTCSHPRFHWWKPNGLSIIETLKEIGAPQDMIDKAAPIGFDPNAIRH